MRKLMEGAGAGVPVPIPSPMIPKDQGHTKKKETGAAVTLTLFLLDTLRRKWGGGGWRRPPRTI